MSALQKTIAPDFAAARFHMVECQVRPNKVTDGRILDIMSAVPREVFVPPELAGIAYIDEDLQVAPGRYLLEPMILARLLQEADIKTADRVLDVAAATGYSSAILAGMAKEITSVESDDGLHKQALNNFANLAITNIDAKHGALTEGYSAKAPFDIIIINGSIDFVPDALFAQLAEGGKVLAVLRQFAKAHAAHTGEARIYEKVRGAISHRVLFDANVKILPGFQAKPTFVF